MLYLLKPDGSSEWADYLSRQLIERHEIDFTKVQWDPAGRRLDIATLELALRHGYVVRNGIAVDPIDLVPLDHLRELLKLNPDDNRLTDLPGRELMEALLGPEWTEQSRELDDRVKESHNASVERARVELREALDVPRKDELVEHWLGLIGGPIWLRD